MGVTVHAMLHMRSASVLTHICRCYVVPHKSVSLVDDTPAARKKTKVATNTPAQLPKPNANSRGVPQTERKDLNWIP